LLKAQVAVLIREIPKISSVLCVARRIPLLTCLEYTALGQRVVNLISKA